MIYSILSEALIESNKISLDKKNDLFHIFTESRYRFIKETFNHKFNDNEKINNYIIEYINKKEEVKWF